MTRRRVARRAAAVLAAVLLLGPAAWIAWFESGAHRDPIAPAPTAAADPGGVDAAQVARGAYLARAGNCAGCHTAPGGAAYAGGRAIETPFGAVASPNLTPDDATGIGRWPVAAFRRAMRDGVSLDGRLLSPVFPYPNYTHVRTEDVDDIYAFLRSLPPVRQAPPDGGLRFPYGTQSAIAAWRALYFSPADPNRAPAAAVAAGAETPEQARGRYLVVGLGHCAACHAERNALGATRDAAGLGGGAIPMQGWHAPSLAADGGAGIADWPADAIVDLLKTGISARGAAMGPMAEVVLHGTQHLDTADLLAIAAHLRALPARPPRRVDDRDADATVTTAGERLYAEHCADCHGGDGRGVAGVYPPLRDNGAVIAESPDNVVQAILHGGFPPATAGNPRPYGMPPYGPTLDDREIAAVATWIRRAWGHSAPAVSPLAVQRRR